MEAYGSWRQSTDGGIKYRKVEGPTITSEDLEHATAHERYIIRAADLDAFHLESFPLPVAYLGMFLLPDRRRMPGSTVFATRRLKFSPAFMPIADPLGADTSAPALTYNLDAGDTDATAGYVHVDIDYEVSRRSFNANPADPETFMERSLQAGLQVQAYPSHRTQVADGVAGATIQPADWEENTDAGMLIQHQAPLVTIRCRWPYALSPDWPLLIASLGKVNSVARPLLLNYEPDTVLFDGLSASQRFLWAGASTYAQPWQLDMSFTAKRIIAGNRVFGWNQMYQNQKRRWVFVRIANQDGATYLYPRMDFYTLFTVLDPIAVP
jgi:hypothetical protein